MSYYNNQRDPLFDLTMAVIFLLIILTVAHELIHHFWN